VVPDTPTRRHPSNWNCRALAQAPRTSTPSSRIRPVATLHSGPLNWYDAPISNGPLEGACNKTKTMKRQARRLRDTEFLKVRILAIHETKHALDG